MIAPGILDGWGLHEVCQQSFEVSESRLHAMAHTHRYPNIEFVADKENVHVKRMFIGVGAKSAGLLGFILSAANPDCTGRVVCRDSRVAT